MARERCQRAGICQPIGSRPRVYKAFAPGIASMHFAPGSGMTLQSRSVRYVADVVGRVLGRLAAMIIGFVLMIVGVAMMVTIVMLPVGVVVALLGVGVFVAGLFAPIESTTSPERNGGSRVRQRP